MLTDLNSCELAGENDAIGFAKVIGGTFRAGLSSVNDANLAAPTFTMLKFCGVG